MVIFLQGCDAKSFTNRDGNALWHKENSASFPALDERIFDGFPALKDASLKGLQWPGTSRNPTPPQLLGGAQHQVKKQVRMLWS